MNPLERRLRASRPAPVSAPDHRRQLRAAIRLRTAAAGFQTGDWAPRQYAAGLAASLALAACVCGWALLAPMPRPADEPALRTLITEFENIPPPHRLHGAVRPPDDAKGGTSPTPPFAEQRRLLNHLLATGM